MNFLIIYEDSLLKLQQTVCESEDHFFLRVEFFIHALNKGYNMDIAETLSYAYQNKLKYNVSYIPEVEESIIEISKDISPEITSKDTGKD